MVTAASECVLLRFVNLYAINNGPPFSLYKLIFHVGLRQVHIQGPFPLNYYAIYKNNRYNALPLFEPNASPTSWLLLCVFISLVLYLVLSLTLLFSLLVFDSVNFKIQGFAICGALKTDKLKYVYPTEMKESFISLETIKVVLYSVACCWVAMLSVPFWLYLLCFFRYFIRWLLHSRLYFTNGWNIYCRCIKARKLNTGVFRWRLWIQQKKKTTKWTTQTLLHRLSEPNAKQLNKRSYNNSNEKWT